MKVIIMGCGRVGVQVSTLLSEEGHDVAVIDSNSEALERLGPNFRGRKIRGVGFDRNILVQAGIEDADAFAATSPSDNANIIAARIARNIFHIPRVVARLYDPRRVEIYRRLGLLTISSTTWGAERIREMLTHADLDMIHSFGHGEVELLEMETPSHLVGQTVRNLQISGEISIVTIVRDGKAFIPISGATFQPDDILHLAVLTSAMDRLKEMFGYGEAG
jgi:trk system potassium uptake protein